MRLFAVAALLLSSLSVALCRDPPTLSSSFTSGLSFQSVPWSLNPTGQIQGYYIQNQDALQSLLVVNETTYNVFVFNDYTKHVEYHYIPVLSYCDSQATDNSFSNFFAWVPYSSYEGQEVHAGLEVDVWNVTTATNALQLFIRNLQPLRLVSASSDVASTTIIDFYDYDPSTPATLPLPSYCTANKGLQQVHMDVLDARGGEARRILNAAVAANARLQRLGARHA